MPPPSLPALQIRHTYRLGGGNLRVPRREAQALGLDPHGRELLEDVVAVLLGDDPGSPLAERRSLAPPLRVITALFSARPTLR